MQDTRIVAKNLFRDGALTYSTQHPQFPAVCVQEDDTTIVWRSRFGTGTGNGLFVVPSNAYGVALSASGDGGCGATTGWTPGRCTIASIAGGVSGNCLEMTVVSGTNQYATMTVSLTAGKLYKLTGYVKSGTSGNESAGLRIYSSGGAYAELSATLTSSATWQLITQYYYAQYTGTHNIYFYKWTATAGTMLFDSLYIQEYTTGRIIPFDEGSSLYYAVVAAGNYNGTTLAAAVNSALDTAGGTYTVAYDEATGKFTIARAAGNFTLYWSTNNNMTSMLGFDGSASDTGAATYTSDYARWNTCEYLDIDNGVAIEFDTLSLRGHNFSATATVTLYAADDAAFTTNLTTDSIAYNTSNLTAFLAAARTKRYVRIYIVDVDNASGYIEIGTIILGKYRDFGCQFIKGYGRGHGNDSQSETTPSKNRFLTVAAPALERWRLKWLHLSATARGYVAEAVQECGGVFAVLWCFDYTAPNDNTYWALMQEPVIPEEYSPSGRWSWDVELEEHV